MNKKKLQKLKEESIQYDIKSGTLKWSNRDTALLKELIAEGITASKFIHTKKIFPNRTRGSIKSKITELRGLV